MKTAKHLTTPILLLTISIVISACNSNDLSRQKAAELITKQLKLPVAQTVVLGSYYKSASSDPASGAFGISASCMVSGDGDKYSDVENALAELKSNGLISIGEKSERSGECTYFYATTHLTDEGRKYLVKESDGTHEVKTCDIAFGEVTGIQINEQMKTAEADYTLKIVNITPFGKNVSTKPIYKKASFSLYDDGWRIR